MVNKNSTTIISHFHEHLEKCAEKTAFVFLADGEKEKAHLTFGEIDFNARVIAGYLQKIAKAGDRIILCYAPGLDFINAFMACLYAGMIAVPVFPLSNNHHAKRLLYIVSDCKSKVVLGTDDSLLAMKSIPGFSTYHFISTEKLVYMNDFRSRNITPDMIAFLQYTSGSTGDPKGVMVNHRNLITNEIAMSELFKVESNQINVSWLPMQHDMGLMGHMFLGIYSGYQEVFMSPTAFFEKPVRWLKAISDYHAYGTGGPNFAYQLCVDRISDEDLVGLDLSSLEVAVNGAEPIRKNTQKSFYKKFSRYGFKYQAFMPCYGMAECTLMVSAKPKETEAIIVGIDKKAMEKGRFIFNEKSPYLVASSGRIYKDYTVKIVNPSTLNEAKKGEIGEIWIYGPSVCQGYWSKTELTQQTFKVNLKGDSRQYLRTGDLGFVYGRNIFITGRLRDRIILNGRIIYPQDIEIAVEKSHPAVREYCTAAFSVEIDGQEQLVVVAEIERTYRKADYQPIFSAIRQSLGESVDVEPYAIHLLAPAKALRTTSGKIQRQATKAGYIAGNLSTIASDNLPAVYIKSVA
jgi:acyl-CoA synthetase (AMP-forming)/AMP-acid ligase II